MASEIRISELDTKSTIDDENLIIVEDDIDTKKSTVLDLKNAFNGDYSDPSTQKFYTSDKMNSMLRQVKTESKAENKDNIDDVKQQLNNLLATTAKTPLAPGTVIFDIAPDKESQYADWHGGTWDCIGNVDIRIGNKDTYFYVYQKTAGVDYPDSACTLELVAARGKYSSLSDRLAAERVISDTKYMEYPLVSLKSTTIPIVGKKENTEVALLFKNAATKNFSFVRKSANYFNITSCKNADADGVSVSGTQITLYMYKSNQKSFEIKLADTPLQSGTYYMYGDIRPHTSSGATGISFDVVYSDGTYDTFSPRLDLDVIEFTARKSFSKLKINVIGTMADLSSSPSSDPSLVSIDHLMISPYRTMINYCPYFAETINHTAESETGDVVYNYICQYETIFTSSIDIEASYNDSTYSTAELIKIVKDTAKVDSLNTDHCGLMESPGTYIFFDDCTNGNEKGAKISKDATMERNSRSSVKVTLQDYDSTNINAPLIIKNLESVTSFDGVKYVSLQLYIDRTLYSNMYDNNGISIILTSETDLNTHNYYTYNIGKKLFVQGWNTIKVRFSDFTKVGSPNIKSIRQIRITSVVNNSTPGYSFWINSVILDQKIAPTILLAFDGAYDTAFTYQYPLLYSNNIPATLFINDRVTWNKEYMNKICSLIYEYGWDLGDYGCNPNKELLTEDDNPREQYLALKSAKEYIVDNYCSDPISYSASFGNLRPITVPILKSLGFRIGKCESDAYCSFFSKNDFSIPMTKLSNSTTADKVISKLDYAVETGQCIVIYTGNVTEYGDENAASKTAFEKVISHVQDLVKNNKAQCLTFKDFYSKCVNE